MKKWKKTATSCWVLAFSTLQTLAHLIRTTTLQGGYRLCFTVKDTNAPRDSVWQLHEGYTNNR